MEGGIEDDKKASEPSFDAEEVAGENAHRSMMATPPCMVPMAHQALPGPPVAMQFSSSSACPVGKEALFVLLQLSMRRRSSRAGVGATPTRRRP